MKILKPVLISMAAIMILFYFIRGIPAGNKTIYVELLETGTDFAGTPKTGSVFYYYADVRLQTGEEIRLKSNSRDLLDFTGGYIEVESYFSPVRFKTVYILKNY